MPTRGRLTAALPDFPWDSLAAAKARAGATRAASSTCRSARRSIRRRSSAAQALAGRRRQPRLPPHVRHRRPLREAMAAYLTDAWGAVGLAPTATLPAIGTKELVAWLPTLLGLGPDDLVVFPTMAYPTYEVGARIAGCRVLAADDPGRAGGRATGAGLAQLAVQPDRADPRRRRAAPPGRLGPRAGSDRRLRRVLRRVRLGRRAGLGAAPVGLRRRPRPVCWRCTRCPSAPTWPATGPASSPATRPWWPSCWPSASTPG